MSEEPTGTASGGSTPQPVPRHDPASQGLTFGPRSHHLLMLEFGDPKDFDDPRLEWRRLFSELLGTFFLVLVGAGGAVIEHADGTISRARPSSGARPHGHGGSSSSWAPSPAPTSTPPSASPSRCAATSPGSGSPGTSSCSCSGRRSPASSCTPSSATSRTLGATLPGPGYVHLAGDPDGDRPHVRAGQRDPRHGVGRPERRRHRRRSASAGTSPSPDCGRAPSAAPR